MKGSELARWKATKMAEAQALPPKHRRIAQDAILDTVLVWERLEKLIKGAGCPFCGSHNLHEHAQMILCRGCGKRAE